MSKVVQLPGTWPTTSADEPCEHVIERLEELLAEARSGALRGLVYGAIRRDRQVAANWVSADCDSNDLLAAASDLLDSLRRVRAAFAQENGSIF